MRRVLVCAVMLWAIGAASAYAQAPAVTAVPKATCGPGSQPESPGSLQGETPVADQDSGRSTKPYTCNMTLVGNDNQTGASWQNTWYQDCDYYDTSFSSTLGTQVVDVSDPAAPKTTEALTSAAMLDPWESLSVNEKRGLLAGVAVNSGQSAGFFDVYDVTKDCKHPTLLSDSLVSGINHEGNWAWDGMTYYASGLAPGLLTAIDVKDPAHPMPITSWLATNEAHGLSTSDDGNRLYLADIAGQNGQGNGMSIWDTSGIQARQVGTQPKLVGSVGWSDGSTAQMTIPVTWGGHPFVVHADELGKGAARIIDIADEAHPKVISEVKLEIDLPQNADRAAESENGNGSFGYDAHYCNVDQRVDPTILVCSEFLSGLRVFDVRDPYHPKEIAYYNPGGTGKAPSPGSQDGSSVSRTGYPSARPRIIRSRGEIWFTDQNKGFLVTRFTNGVWPFADNGPTPAAVGLPPTRKCLRTARIKVRLKLPHRNRARSAVVYLNGKRVKTVRGRALRRPIVITLPRGHSVVRIVARNRGHKRYVQTKDYTRCG